jgi:localization factor PodJL
MASRGQWSVDGLEPSVRERAEAAARQSGMSLNDWVNSAVGSQTAPAPDAREVAEIHHRLDAIARQVEQISQPFKQPSRSEPAVARQLNDAISRLDARLSQITNQRPVPPQREPAWEASPPLSPTDNPQEFSVAEIIARQGELNGNRQTAARMPAPTFVAPQGDAPAALSMDFSGLERQLADITSQIQTLHRPDDRVEQSITAFRSELAEIRQAITEALPRQAIESLEGEIRSLGRRIDETRQTGIDSNALAGIERALSDIYSSLRTLTPAEQLAGFDDAIRNLGGKLDSIVRSSSDPGTINQLEEAIAALRNIVANVASNEALAQLAGDVRSLSAKVDQLAQSAGNADILSALEQRIAVLTSALEQRERAPAADSSYFDNAVRTISDRLDNLQVGSDSSATFNHVEQRVAHLIERLEATGQHPASFGKVEEGLSEVLRLLQDQRAASAPSALAAAPMMDPVLVDAIKRELADLRYSQSETDRRTQDSLEVVHNTLGHVVDRLAHIEGDLRAAARANPPSSEPKQSPPPPQRAAAQRALNPQPRPELPNPALAQAIPPQRPIADAPSMKDAMVPSAQREPAPAAPAPRPAPAARLPIDPDLPPDHPLEPGTRLQPGRASPAERIAASEIALSEIKTPPLEPITSTNFIQAARRAAQAASSTPSGDKPNRVTALNDAARAAAKTPTTASSPVASKIRALLVGASVVVIVLGTVKMGMNLLSSGDPMKSEPAVETSVTPAPETTAPLDEAPDQDETPQEPRSEAPSMTSPTPIGKQSMTAPPVPYLASAQSRSGADITGSIAQPSSAAPAQLPDAIGGPVLRAAALKGDPRAAYEIGLRYAEGRGVASNYTEAAKWYERAAQGDVVPAMFRLGTLHEKGLGTTKDMTAARRFYEQAAARGNAKAMHNLAVIEADGGNKGPNYKVAAEWFRKAAERGIADSQFNLGILYARGIGVEQNLAESFKWFSLAAAHGDTDAGRKRDDVAKRLDSESLAAAKLAVQTFSPEKQPDEAVNVPAPTGGWDAKPHKSAAKPASTRKSAAR